MTWAVISTWKMSWKGCTLAADLLQQGQRGSEAVIRGIQDVEDNPEFRSVGYGGLPDEEGRVLLDGAFMNGDSLHFGAVAAMEGFRSPIAVAHSLAKYDFNNFLAGKGAEKYAAENGFERRNNLTEESRAIYEKKRGESQSLSAYDGHDTVCFAVLDQMGSMYTGVSTSGLFLKKCGRVGDSPVAGSGFYADSRLGAACATGVGEEIMKGVLSYNALRNLKAGMSPQEAAETAVSELSETLIQRNGKARSMSLILLDNRGNFGVGTNIRFPFVYAAETSSPTLYLAEAENGRCRITPVRDKDSLDID